MVERSHASAASFGRRRPADPAAVARDAPPIGAPRPDPGESDRSTGTVTWALRVAAVTGFAAVFATQYLARLSEPAANAGTQVAQARGLPSDPETTGSIGRGAPSAAPTARGDRPPGGVAGAARATVLDPCTAAPQGRPRP